jgi:hypothetical protein
LPIDPRVIATSPDGVNWTFVPAPPSGNADGLTSVVWNGSEFVAVGGLGIVLRSTDGTNWVTDDSGSVSFFNAIATTGGECIAAGLDGHVMINNDCGQPLRNDEIFTSGFEAR